MVELDCIVRRRTIGILEDFIGACGAGGFLPFPSFSFVLFRFGSFPFLSKLSF